MRHGENHVRLQALYRGMVFAFICTSAIQFMFDVVAHLVNDWAVGKM